MSYSGDEIDSVLETLTGDLVERRIAEERELIARYIEEQIAGRSLRPVREVAAAIRRGEYGR